MDNQSGDYEQYHCINNNQQTKQFTFTLVSNDSKQKQQTMICIVTPEESDVEITEEDDIVANNNTDMIIIIIITLVSGSYEGDNADGNLSPYPANKINRSFDNNNSDNNNDDNNNINNSDSVNLNRYGRNFGSQVKRQHERERSTSVSMVQKRIGKTDQKVRE